MLSNVPIFERVGMKNIEPTVSRRLSIHPWWLGTDLTLGSNDTFTDNRWEVGFIGHSCRCRAAGYKGRVSKAKLCRTTERQKNLLDCGRWLYKSFWFREQYPGTFVGLLVGLVRTGLTYPLTYCFLWASSVFNIFFPCFSSCFLSNRLPVFRSS